MKNLKKDKASERYSADFEEVLQWKTISHKGQKEVCQ